MKNLIYYLFFVITVSSCSYPCEDTNCLNGGQCFDGECQCPEGFTGDNCEIEIPLDEDIDEIFEVSPCDNQETILYNGDEYNLVEMNNDCWFAENLKTTKFSNGDDIIHEMNTSTWYNSSNPMYCVLNHDNENIENFGLLYNYKVVIDERNVCPVGWRVPRDLDWRRVELFIGVPYLDLSTFSHVNTNRADGFAHKLKSSPYDDVEWNGTNDYNFSVVPSGYRWDNGFSELYDGVPNKAIFWTSDIYNGISNHAINREFTLGSDEIRRLPISVNDGLSIRCVKIQ